MSHVRPVVATVVSDGWREFSDLGGHAWVKATIRPLRELSSQPGEPGIAVDLVIGGAIDLEVELGVTDMLPVVEEASRLWYDDQGIDPPEYIAEPAPPTDADYRGDDRDAALSAARECGCCECLDYIAEQEPTCDCD